MSRAEEIEAVSDDRALWWLANQMDQMEAAQKQDMAEFRTENREDHAAMRKSMTAQQAVMIGILVSVTTAAILLALNLAVGG